jgi:hypothetical protein
MLCPYHNLHGQSRDTLHYHGQSRPGWVWPCKLQSTKLVSTKIDFMKITRYTVDIFYLEILKLCCYQFSFTRGLCTKWRTQCRVQFRRARLANSLPGVLKIEVASQNIYCCQVHVPVSALFTFTREWREGEFLT